MEKIAIVGGGIIGLTLANLLPPEKFEITLYDEPTGQATKASAGIISPWLSKRRNKQWYQLAKAGAALLPKLAQDFQLDEAIYRQVGSLILQPEENLAALTELAETRKIDAPEIGDIHLLSNQETAEMLPLLKPQKSLFITGGARLDGLGYLNHLKKIATDIQFHNEKVQIKNPETLLTSHGPEQYDRIVLAVGPHLKELSAPLNYQVDIRPQKGQLIVFETNFTSEDWPVAMLAGESDLIPFNNGKILLGATHENDANWDLEPTNAAFHQLTEGAASFLIQPEKLFQFPHSQRVGTRAYTSDFAPFFGELPDGIIVASGLGSSGLTTGPMIANLLANFLNNHEKKWDSYQKPLINYLK